MSDRIVFEKDGVRVTEIIKNPVTGEREVDNIVSYEDFAKYSELRWLVKSIRPIIKQTVLTGLEVEKDDINSGSSTESGYVESQKKWTKPINHKFDWFHPYVLEVVKEYEPVSRKEIVRRVFERVQTELWEGDFAKLRSGGVRWETMVRWAVTQLKGQGKIYSAGRNQWRFKKY